MVLSRHARIGCKDYGSQIALEARMQTSSTKTKENETRDAFEDKKSD